MWCSVTPWEDQDLESLVEASLVESAANATEYMYCKFVQLTAAAAAAASFGGLSNQSDWMRELANSDFAVLVGTLAFVLLGTAAVEGNMALDFGSWWVVGVFAEVFQLFLCRSGGRTPKAKDAKDVFIPFFSQTCCCQVDQDHAQGSGEHGAVTSLPVGLGQASGRVDVPDGAKIEAAAASSGASRFRPWNAGALREVESKGQKIKFFLRGRGVSTRVVRCVDTDTRHEAVGFTHEDIHMTLRCRVVSIHDTLLRNGIKSNCTVTTRHRVQGDPITWMCKGGGGAAFALPRGVGLQGGRAVGAVHDG